jgi:hypothetical protein
MRRFAALLIASTLCVAVTTCAKKPPTAGPQPRRPDFIAEAAPEPIATPGIWFAFDPDFIRHKYRSADLAFGTFTVSDEWRASAVHDENCSGEDGEVHRISWAKGRSCSESSASTFGALSISRQKRDGSWREGAKRDVGVLCVWPSEEPGIGCSEQPMPA